MSGSEGDEAWPLRHPFWSVALFVAAFTVVGFALSLIDGPFDPVKVGSLGEWASGLGAVAVVAFALHEIGQARRSERARAESEVESDRRRQAEQVCAWFAGPYSENPGGPERVRVKVMNASTLPIYGTFVEVLRTEDVDGGWAIPHEPVGVVGPEDVPQVIDTSSGIERSDGKVTRPGIAVRFQDAAGTYWRRDAKGQLHEEPGPPFYANTANVGQPRQPTDPSATRRKLDRGRRRRP